MKKNDTDDFSIIHVEASDQRADLFQMIGVQKKPVILLFAEQTTALQKPDDFTLLKYVKRQINLPIIFVLPQGGQQALLAARNGFPVYQSMDALADALSVGQIGRAHTSNQSVPARPTDRQTTNNLPRTRRSTNPLVPNGVGQKQALAQTSGLSAHQSSSLYHTMQSTAPHDRADEIPEYTQHYSKTAPTGGHITLRNTTPLAPEEASPPITYLPWSLSDMPSTDQEQPPFNPVTPLPFTEIPEMTQTVDIPQPHPQHNPNQDEEFAPFHMPLQAPDRRKRRNSMKTALLLTLTCILVLGVIGSFLIGPHLLSSTATPPQNPGKLVFTSSGQVSETTSQGIEDQLTLDLTNVAAPASGKALYAWILGDKTQSDPQSILLGKLQIINGNAHIFYPGDGQHTNLLLTMSRLLVTEEDASVTPIAPSPDQNAWRYYGEISATPINAPDNTEHFSFLDHLRHLLASDPTLNEFELPGGLNNWLYNNTGKVMEWIGSIRQQWEETKDTGFVRRQLARSLQFIDGDTFVYQDLPANSTLLVNERLARIGLLNITGPNQEPPDYLNHVTKHLNGLLEAQPSPALRQKIADLISALANVKQWLTQVRKDAQQLMHMSDNQLQQQSTLTTIDDMIANMDNAYSGQPDPSTGIMHEGVNWIHDQMQFLATLDVQLYNVNTNQTPSHNIPIQAQPRALLSEDKSVKR